MEDIVDKIIAKTVIFGYWNVLECSNLTIFEAENYYIQIHE